MTMNSGNGQQKEPIEGHDKCPECGSEKRLIGDFVAELRESGAISQESFPNSCGAWEIPFLDLKKVSALQVPGAVRPYPVMRILWEVCGECIKPYVRKVEYAQRGMIQQPAASQQFQNITP